MFFFGVEQEAGARFNDDPQVEFVQELAEAEEVGGLAGEWITVVAIQRECHAGIAAISNNLQRLTELVMRKAVGVITETQIHLAPHWENYRGFGRFTSEMNGRCFRVPNIIALGGGLPTPPVVRPKVFRYVPDGETWRSRETARSGDRRRTAVLFGSLILLLLTGLPVFALTRPGELAPAVPTGGESIGQRDPTRAAIYQGRGIELVNAGKFEPALDQFRRALACEPANPNALINAAYCLDRLGRYEDAIEELRRAEKINPTNPMIFINWGNSLINLKRYADALEPLQRARDLDGSNQLVRLNLAAAFANSGQPEKALPELAGAAKINSNNPTVFSNWALILVGLGRSADAIEKYRQASALDTNNPALLLNQAVLEEKIGRHLAAAQTLEKAAQLDPKNATITFNLAVVLTAAGESARAIAAYDRAIALDPKNISAYYNCAALHERTGDLAGAIAKIEAALRMDPGNATLTDILTRLQATRDKRGGVIPILPGATLQ